MKWVFVIAMTAGLLGCGSMNRTKQTDWSKLPRVSIRFPRPGEGGRDKVTGPMVRAISVAGLETRRYLQEHHLPECFATPEGTDFLVSDTEVPVDGGKKSMRVFYVTALLNPQHCNAPEDVASQIDGFDYIVSDQGQLLKAARIQHLE